MKITNIPAGARALAHDIGNEGVVDAMRADGLEIEERHIAFPDHMLNSVTWVVGWKWEILYYEDRRDQTPSEINEMEALKRLLTRLKKLGGAEDLAQKYDI